MTSDRKHPSVALWIIVALLVVLVGVIVYPLSFLPFLWLDNQGWLPKWIIAMPIYAPLQWLRVNGPLPIREALDWYINFCSSWG